LRPSNDRRTNAQKSINPASRKASGPVTSLDAILLSDTGGATIVSNGEPGWLAEDTRLRLSSENMPVKTSVTELPESRVRVQAEVPAEEVERRVLQTARELGRSMRIPGFRKGKVPPPVVIGRLGRDAVLDETLRSALSAWYADAIDGAGITPVGDPELSVPDELPDEGQPLSFSIEVGVRPRAALGTYKGLEVGRREPWADEKLVDEELERLRDRIATLETVERAAASGDQVVIDYEGTTDGDPFPGSEGRDQLLELGTGRLLPGFDEQLTGASAGDHRTIEVTFPDGELAGKQATFDVTVKEVKAKRLPELDDDFAVEVGFDTLAELRDDIATRIKEADEAAVEREYRQAVLDAAVAEAKIDVPPKLIHARAHELVHQTFDALGRQGISREAYLRIAGKDEEELAKDTEPEAEAILKREAVLAAVVDAEQIEPSDEELLEAIRPIAERDNQKPEKVLQRLRDRGRLGPLTEDISSRQALELLVSEAKPISVEQAKARDKLWTPEKGEERPGQLWTPDG
jgi:trigger factor